MTFRMTAEPGDAPLILVVDDDPDLTKLVDFRLRRAGYRTMLASDGLQALRAIGAERPDLVLLDIDMPNLDGRAVARVIRGAGEDAPTVIFVTAQASVSDRIEGIDLGAADYVTKPFSSPELLARVEVALRLRRRDHARIQFEGA
jgi:DNA-binding response OmpR family regulator